MYFVCIGLLFFLYVRNITFQISHIYSENKKKSERSLKWERPDVCSIVTFVIGLYLWLITMIMIICFWVEMIIIISYEWFSWRYSFITIRAGIAVLALFLCLKFIHFFRVFCSLSFNICHSLLPIFSSLLHTKKRLRIFSKSNFFQKYAILKCISTAIFPSSGTGTW